MLIAISIGLIAGLCVGFALNITYPTEYSFYITMALLAALDSVIGATRASMIDQYDNTVFISGFVVNTLMAALLTFVGDQLGVPLYYAAILVFGGRLFNNVAVIRRMALDNYREKKRRKKEQEEKNQKE